jgi:pimeloyl-ACP methyl ester carboxylesterase
MNRTIFNLLSIVCSLSLTILVFYCTCENSAFGAENEFFQFSEDSLSQEVEWEKCELFNDKKRLRKAECADITVPLYWDNPEGATMKIHVKRLKSLLRATKQMWLLAGGPGEAGTDVLPAPMKTIAQLDWRTDLYTLDHRGTGYSERLSCPEQEADNSEEGFTISESEWDACIDYLEASYDLDAFTATQAAIDLGFLVELLKEESKEIFIMGGSYGTYWGHRYAQIFPDQADGIILDSVVPSVGSDYDWSDIDVNNVVKDFFDTCKNNEFCSSKFVGDPWEEAINTFEKFKKGHCSELFEGLLTPELLQIAADAALDYIDLRVVLPVLYYRIDRCSEEDVKAINHLMEDFYPKIVPPEDEDVPTLSRQFSDVLRFHIASSELMSDNPLSPEEMKEIDKTLLATSHFIANRFLPQSQKWPVYDADMYYHNWASQEVPILMFNGTLDQRTPIDKARIAQDNLTGPNQYFIEVPNAKHIVTFNSPVKSIFALDCGMQIMLDFMEDPLEKPDTSCLDNLVPIDFHGNPLMALVLFGTWDLWENGINTSLSDDQISQMKKEADNILRDLRQLRSRMR